MCREGGVLDVESFCESRERFKVWNPRVFNESSKGERLQSLTLSPPFDARSYSERSWLYSLSLAPPACSLGSFMLIVEWLQLLTLLPPLMQDLYK